MMDENFSQEKDDNVVADTDATCSGSETNSRASDSSDHNAGQDRPESLQDFYREVSGLSFRDPAQGRKLIKAFVEQCHLYTGAADIWFNLTAETGRLQLHKERQIIVKEGLREHPNNVDLLCEVLQGSYGMDRNPAIAQETWSQLSALEESKFYWRYWVYGAMYHGVMLRNQEQALDLLDKGLYFVSSDHINDMVRAYRRVLIDVPPMSTTGISSLNERQEFEIAAFSRLEGVYKWAINLGIENSYDLATELAKLYQEQAILPSLNAEKQTSYLELALEYLDLAERRYTANPNHTVWEIYLLRARIYMGLRKCSEAFLLFSVIPENVRENDPSIEVQFNYAAKMAGEAIPKKESAASSSPSVKDQIEQDPQSFFQQLFGLAANSPQVKGLLMGLTNQLMNDE
jgi:tetratricopeptide (TPR) repeat protein